MSSNRNVYIAGSLTNPKGYHEKTQLYDLVVKVCEQYSFTLYAPHIEKRKRHTLKQDVSPAMIFEWDYKRLKQSDLIIAYIGIPSIGVGMELGLAAEWSIPVVSFCEEDTEISPMLLGHPSLKRHIQFRTEAEFLEKLTNALAEI